MASNEEIRTLTLEEVAKHNERKSVWLLIHDSVYDVTKFLEEHPGGEEMLTEEAGQDATDSFEGFGHSSDARNLMKHYMIGELCEDDKQKTKQVQEKNHWGSYPDEASSWLSWAIPVGIALLATFLYVYK